MFTTEPVYLPDNYYEGSEDQTKGRADPHALGTVKAASEAGWVELLILPLKLHEKILTFENSLTTGMKDIFL
jgi:hypothetical protein